MDLCIWVRKPSFWWRLSWRSLWTSREGSSNNDIHLLFLAREGAHMFSREDLEVYIGEYIGLDSVLRLWGDLILLSSLWPNCTVMAKTQKGRCKDLFTYSPKGSKVYLVALCKIKKKGNQLSKNSKVQTDRQSYMEEQGVVMAGKLVYKENCQSGTQVVDKYWEGW